MGAYVGYYAVHAIKSGHWTIISGQFSHLTDQLYTCSVKMSDLDRAGEARY